MDVILTVDAIKRPLTGIGRYAVELARRLPAHPDVDDLWLFGDFKPVASVDGALASHEFSTRVRRHVPFKSAAMRVAFALRQLRFTRATGDRRRALLHCPNFVALRHEGPTVTTVHDLSWIHFPEFHPPERVSFMNRMMPLSMERSTFVLTDSEFVRREVISHWGVDPARVRAIPLGVSDEFVPGARHSAGAALAKFGLEGVDYLLSVATLEPRKNLGRVVDAYSRLPAHVRAQHPLVVAGGEGWAFGADERALATLERAGQVKRLGYVPESDLHGLLAAAHGFVFASVYEGFGLPLLEAMSAGVPTLYARGSSLDELAERVGIAVDPLDVDSITAGLLRLAQDGPWRAAARGAGIERASHFGWNTCVARTVDVYREAGAVC